MTPYHKIPTVFERDPATKYKTLIDGKFATQELAYLSDCMWEFTEKIDGTNVRVIYESNMQNNLPGGMYLKGRKEKSPSVCTK